MPYFIHIILTLAVIIHVFKTNQERYWIFICILIPGIGPLAYFIVVILPTLMGSKTGYKLEQKAKRIIAPRADLKSAENAFKDAPTFVNKLALADTYFSHEKYAEAERLYLELLTGLYENDADILLKLAKTQYFLNKPEETLQTLDRLRLHHPDFDSSEGHLFYAKALAKTKNEDKAIEEFTALVRYYRGYEARVSFAEALIEFDKKDDAKKVLDELSEEVKRAPSHVKELNSESIQRMKTLLKGLK